MSEISQKVHLLDFYKIYTLGVTGNYSGTNPKTSGLTKYQNTPDFCDFIFFINSQKSVYVSTYRH